MKNIIINFKNYWFLITQLISRDFKVKYKRSVLGVVWSLLNPILMMTVMSIVFSHMFKMKVEGQNYLVYLMTGIIMWNFFSEATNMSMVSVVDNFSLINKIYIPKYVFPISKVLFVCINFMLTLIPWIGIIILSNFGLGKYPCPITFNYLLLPYIFVCFVIFIIGIGLILSSTSVFLRDIWYIYGIVLIMWNYLTPVFYSLEIIPGHLQKIFKINPLYQYISQVRQIVMQGVTPDLLHLAILLFIALLSITIGGIVFKKNQDKFIYYV